jgi:hypothetical protein
MVDEEGRAQPRRLIGSVSEAHVFVLHDGTLLEEAVTAVQRIGDRKR